jgi:hypothetical protein
VSLILDALKKLEHEKNTREPGVLVVGSVPWGERRRSRLPLVLAAAALVALAFAGWWWLRPTPHPTAAVPAPVEPVPVAPAPTPSPVVAVAPTAPPPSVTLAPYSAAPAPPARPPAVPTLDQTPGPPTPPEGAAAATGTRPAPDDLRLNAITRRDGRPVALVNDRLVFEGDSFDGVKVLRIGEAEVEVEVRGQRRVLRF